MPQQKTAAIGKLEIQRWLRAYRDIHLHRDHHFGAVRKRQELAHDSVGSRSLSVDLPLEGILRLRAADPWTRPGGSQMPRSARTWVELMEGTVAHRVERKGARESSSREPAALPASPCHAAFAWSLPCRPASETTRLAAGLHGEATP